MNFRKPHVPHEKIFKQYMKVAYIPLHANRDMDHDDVEYGFVSSVNEKVVFVKFSKQLAWFGWSGTTSQACDPDSLKVIPNETWPHSTF